MGRGLIHLWQHLSFWKRLSIECPIAIGIMLLVEIVFSGFSGNFLMAALQGLVLGVLFTFPDHAAFAGRTRHSDDEMK
jgi:hypothetical protein